MVSKYGMASKRFLLGCCVNVKSSQASQASKLHARLQLVPGNKLRPSRLVTSRRHEMRRDESADGMSTRTKKSARFARREPIFLAPQGQRRQGGEERKWSEVRVEWLMELTDDRKKPCKNYWHTHSVARLMITSWQNVGQGHVEKYHTDLYFMYMKNSQNCHLTPGHKRSSRPGHAIKNISWQIFKQPLFRGIL